MYPTNSAAFHFNPIDRNAGARVKLPAITAGTWPELMRQLDGWRQIISQGFGDEGRNWQRLAGTLDAVYGGGATNTSVTVLTGASLNTNTGVITFTNRSVMGLSLGASAAVTINPASGSMVSNVVIDGSGSTVAVTRLPVFTLGLGSAATTTYTGTNCT